LEAAKRIAKNTSLLYVRLAITLFISLYSTRLILASLGLNDFGLFNLVGGIISMLGFLNGSMATATQRFISTALGAGDLEKVKRTFNMSLLLHWLLAVLVLLLLEVFGHFFFNGFLNISPDRIESAKLIYQFMIISTLFTVISVPYEAVINSHENMLIYTVIGLIEAVFKLSIALYITFFEMDHLVMYGILMAALSVFLMILKMVYCQLKYAECSLNIRQYYDKSLLKEMSGFASWWLLGLASGMGAFYGQSVVLNIFFGTLINTSHALAAQISGQLGVFAVSLNKAVSPFIDKSEGANDRNLVFLAVFKSTKFSFYLLGFLYVPFLIEMPFILKIWLKDVPEYTIIFCRILLLRNLIEQLFIPMVNALNAHGNIKFFQMVSSTLNVLPIAFSYALFYFGYPPYYMYVLFLIFSIFQFLLVMYFSNKNLNLPLMDFTNDVLIKAIVPFFLSITIALVPFLFISNDLLQFIFVTSLGCISFLYFVYSYGMDFNERDFLFNLLRKFKKNRT